MDHSKLTREQWNLIQNLRVEDCVIEDVGVDASGTIRIVLSYPR